MQRRTMFVIAAFGAAACALPLLISGCPVDTGSPVGGDTSTFNRAPTPVLTSDLINGVAPLTVQFDSGRSTDDGLIMSRSWDFGDGSTSAQIAPRHTFATNGDFTVTLTITDDKNLSASETVDIAVTDAPVAVIAYSPTTVQAAPASVNFDASDSFDDGAIAAYRWDFGDGSRSTAITSTHVYAASGIYETKLTVTDDKGVTGSSSVLVEVGIETPTIEVRVPPPHVKNLVSPSDASIWIQAVFNIELGANRFTHAGLDRDQDLCDAQAVLFGASTGATIYTLVGHDELVNRVVFSPDGALMATCSDDGTVKLYSTAIGAVIKTLSATGPVRVVEFAPDGLNVAWGESSGEIVLVDIATGDVVQTFTGHSGAINDLAFSPDGSEMMSGSDDHHAILWKVADGTVLRDFVHTLAVNAVDISPFDPTMVAAAGEDPLITVWNTVSGTALTTIDAHEEAVNSLAFSPDGQALISGSDDNTAVASSPFIGLPVTTYAGHDGNVTSVAIAPDGARLVTGSADNTVRIWNTATAALIQKLEPCESAISSVAISPDGARYAASVAAYNDIPLTTSPSEGDDYNITFPRELSLKRVPSIGFKDVPNGDYYLWAEIDSNLTAAPVRAYANATVNVVDDFTAAVNASTPVIPLIEGEASVAVPRSQDRQIFDLGELNAGDKVYFSLLSLPAFGQSYTTETEYSIMLLDADEKIVTWHQDLEEPSNGINASPEFYEFVTFTPQTETILGHDSPHNYVVVDGDINVNVRVASSLTGAPDPRQQRFLVRFDGSLSPVSIGGQPAVAVGALNAAEFDPNDASPLVWRASSTGEVKDAVMATLDAVYGDFDIVFVSSDDGVPEFPYATLYVGGASLDSLTRGAFDSVDPRNQTLGGRAIAYANTIARLEIYQPPPVIDDPTEMGVLIGKVAAHEVGFLLGLRNTRTSGDVMRGSDIFDVDGLTETKILKVGALTTTEQVGTLSPIGTQDARLLLEETVGLAP